MSAEQVKIPIDEAEKSEKAKEEVYDPWKLVDPEDTGPKWSERTTCGKIGYVILNFVKVILLLGLLYMFICSLDFLSNAFRLLGGKAAGKVFTESEILQDPVTGPIACLMVGVLATVLVQSSSTSTSIVVSMVAAGRTWSTQRNPPTNPTGDFLTCPCQDQNQGSGEGHLAVILDHTAIRTGSPDIDECKVLPGQTAVFIVMGANIGTSVTNTIVAMGHVLDKDEFRRAFGGATVHDMFNWLAVFCLLPIEAISLHIFGTGFLFWLTGLMINSLQLNTNKDAKKELLKVITKPFTKLIIQIDKKIITQVAEGDVEAEGKSLIKHWCKYSTVTKNVTVSKVFQVTNNMNVTQNVTRNVTEAMEMKVPKTKCVFMFEYVSNYWSDAAVGGALLVIALIVLCVCLVLIVKLLHSMLKGKLAGIIKKTMNADFPGKLGFLTGYLAIVVGALLTILLQSSSIFTSAMTPLVGMGVLHVERMYPLTLGANIGTTFTAILASLASSADKLGITLQVALCHLFFNILGILIWYPIPFMRNVPIDLAMGLGNTTAKYRWFAVTYLIFMFFLLPGLIFALAIPGWYVLVAVAAPLLLLLIIILIINKMQRSCANRLPKKLRSWDFLPKCCHSLEPADRVIMKVVNVKRCCSNEQNISGTPNGKPTGRQNPTFDPIE